MKSTVPVRREKERNKERLMSKHVRVRGAKPLHILHRIADDIMVGAEAWASFDGKRALPVRVEGHDDTHYEVRYECDAKRFSVHRGSVCAYFLDEVRTTPALACVNMVTL